MKQILFKMGIISIIFFQQQVCMQNSNGETILSVVRDDYLNQLAEGSIHLPMDQREFADFASQLDQNLDDEYKEDFADSYEKIQTIKNIAQINKYLQTTTSSLYKNTLKNHAGKMSRSPYTAARCISNFYFNIHPTVKGYKNYSKDLNGEMLQSRSKEYSHQEIQQTAICSDILAAYILKTKKGISSEVFSIAEQIDYLNTPSSRSKIFNYQIENEIGMLHFDKRSTTEEKIDLVEYRKTNNQWLGSFFAKLLFFNNSNPVNLILFEGGKIPHSLKESIAARGIHLDVEKSPLRDVATGNILTDQNRTMHKAVLSKK